MIAGWECDVGVLCRRITQENFPPQICWDNVWASHKHASSFLWHNYNKQLSPSLKKSNYLATRWKLFSLWDATDKTLSPSCLDLREMGRERAKNETKWPRCALFITSLSNDILIDWGDLSPLSVIKYMRSRCVLGHSYKSFKGVEDMKDFFKHFGRKLKDFWTSFSKHSQCVQILDLEGSAWGEPVIPVSWQELCFTKFC